MGAAALKNVVALSSRLYSCKGACARRYQIARSATVSVAVRIKGDYFFHPVRRVRVVATSGLSLPSMENMRPIFGVSAGRRPMH